MSEQLWNFHGIESGSSDILAAVNQTQALLDEGKQSLMALQSIWGGSGSDAYNAVQMKWDSAAADLNSALQSLAQTISEAGSTMAQTEAGVAGTFGA